MCKHTGMRNLVKEVLNNGGTIIPLIAPSEFTNGTGLLNPSVFVDGDRILVNLRHVQYTLYHTDGDFYSRYGPLAYFNPENDITLTTTNFLCEINDNKASRISKVDTSIFDQTPLWEFVGLEDARLVKWDNKFYLSGVRRDTTTNGEGRMELSEIEIGEDYVKEINRFRIPTPFNKDSYCEKNWMPILDKPFHYIKWCNPVEVVKANIGGDTEQIFIGDKIVPSDTDFRGGSQVIPFGDNYICITHQTYLWFNKNNQKDGIYKHKFLIINKDWEIIHQSEEFDFMTGLIEFTCGLAEYKDEMLITFGLADNTAYMLRIPKDYFLKFIYD